MRCDRFPKKRLLHLYFLASETERPHLLRHPPTSDKRASLAHISRAKYYGAHFDTQRKEILYLSNFP